MIYGAVTCTTLSASFDYTSVLSTVQITRIEMALLHNSCFRATLFVKHVWEVTSTEHQTSQTVVNEIKESTVRFVVDE